MNASVSKITSPSPTSLFASSTSSLSSQYATITPAKSIRDSNLWFPFMDLKSEYCKESVYNYSISGKHSSNNNDNQNAAKDLNEREAILSQLSPSSSLSSLTPTPIAQEKKFTPSLCRYFSTPDKHDLFSSYASIVSEVAPSRAASVLPYPTISDIFTHTGQYRSQTPHPSFQHLSHNLHANQKLTSMEAQSHSSPSQHATSNQEMQHKNLSSQIGNNLGSASSAFTANNLFNSHSYPSMLQNISSYDGTAAAAVASSSRCTLPSPTIYPTPPPSAPWNPWAGF